MGSMVGAPYAFQPTRTNSNTTDRVVEVTHTSQPIPIKGNRVASIRTLIIGFGDQYLAVIRRP